MRITIFTGLFFVLIAASASGQPQPASRSPIQTRDEWQKEREAIQKEMEQVKRSLAENHRNKKETLGQLALLQRRLYLREAAIRNINSRINGIENDMKESSRKIAELHGELDTLRAQYAESIVFAYKNRGSYDFLSFIFSVTSFNDAMERIKYIRSYRAYREEQAVSIQRKQGLLQNKIDGLRISREEKDEILEKQKEERQLLETEKQEKDAAFLQLKSQEKELMKEMAVKQRQNQLLATAMEAAIRKTKTVSVGSLKNTSVTRLSKKPDLPTSLPTSNPTSFPNSKSVSGKMEKFIGHLPWPAEGTISMSFGLHEYMKNVHIFNQGITMDVRPGATVKAVFDGEIHSVFPVGNTHAVMIRHGKYFTTYSNLATVSVTKGDQVKTGQIIGHVDDTGQLEFLLSDENAKMYDPEKWLKRY